MDTGKYTLKGHEAVPCEDICKWSEWLESADRHVGKTDIGIPAWKFWLGRILKIKHWEPTRISTVFLGLDHSFGDGPPMLFETMIFGGSLDGEQERYSTWDEAEAGHKRWVEKVRSKQCA